MVTDAEDAMHKEINAFHKMLCLSDDHKLVA